MPRPFRAIDLDDAQTVAADWGAPVTTTGVLESAGVVGYVTGATVEADAGAGLVELRDVEVLVVPAGALVLAHDQRVTVGTGAGAVVYRAEGRAPGARGAFDRWLVVALRGVASA